MTTRKKLIAQLRKPTFPEKLDTYADFKLLAARLDLIAEALASVLDEQNSGPQEK